jgi:pimeloyl-ACP methyl ester carboxylesterase
MAGIARVGEVEIAYEELGDPDGEPLLLVMGLGMQLIAWDERFCALLGERGYRVIRFDNRDVGLSSWTIGPLPRRLAFLAGIRRRLAYTLGDLADDAAGLLDRLGIESAHVVGASMGGMIAQVLGYRHPARVRSLGLIMTGAGKRHLALPRIRVLGAFLAVAPREREAYADHALALFRLIGSPAHPTPEAEIRELLLASYDRAHNPAGVIRQLHAVNASGDRSRALREVRAPTVVIHGTADPLVRPISGRALAREIPDAELLMIEGMGHDLPPQLWPRITEALAANADRAPAAAPVSAAPTAPAS